MNLADLYANLPCGIPLDVFEEYAKENFNEVIMVDTIHPPMIMGMKHIGEDYVGIHLFNVRMCEKHDERFEVMDASVSFGPRNENDSG